MRYIYLPDSYGSSLSTTRKRDDNYYGYVEFTMSKMKKNKIMKRVSAQYEGVHMTN